MKTIETNIGGVSAARSYEAPEAEVIKVEKMMMQNNSPIEDPGYEEPGE